MTPSALPDPFVVSLSTAMAAELELESGVRVNALTNRDALVKDVRDGKWAQALPKLASVELPGPARRGRQCFWQRCLDARQFDSDSSTRVEGEPLLTASPRRAQLLS